MTSVGVKIDNSVTRQSGPYCFKIQGELHHLTGALLPHGDQTPIYAQIYILDTVEQLNIRRNNNRNLDPTIMDDLQTMLLDNHPYIGQYRCYARIENSFKQWYKRTYSMIQTKWSIS